MVNWLIFCSFVLSFSMTILGLLVDLTYQTQIAPKVQSFQQEQIQRLPEYIEDKRFFSKHKVFSPPSRNGKNFADLYGKIIAESPSQRLVDFEQKKTVLALSDSWLDKKHKITFTDEIDQLYNEVEEYSYFKIPEDLDNTVASDLIVSGQVFLAHTFHYQPEALREALSKVRHFARVLLTSEDLNFKRAGLSLLEKELQFMELLKEEWYKAQLIWTPVPPNEIRGFRKFLAHSSQSLSFLTPPEVLTKAFLGENPPPGFCAVMKEKRFFLRWSRVFLNSRFPFEPDFAPNIKAIGEIQKMGLDRCHSINSNDKMPKGAPLAAYVPYYRRLYGIKILLKAHKVEGHL